MSDFAARLDAFLDEFFRLNPLHATAAGLHVHDGRWPDLTDAGRAELLALVSRWETALRGFADDELDADERIDRDLVLMELDAIRFGETRLRPERWNALDWVYLLGDGIFPLVARDFAPLAVRLESLADRLEGLPAVLTAARRELRGHDGRPVSRLHVETAIDQLPGIAELADDALAEAERAAPGDAAVAAGLPRLRSAVATARSALADFAAHLRGPVLEAAEGEGRLGPELFAEKLRHTMRDPTITAEAILAAAERDYEIVRAEMVRLAREIWPARFPGRGAPRDDGAVVRGVLDAIAGDHPGADELLDFCRAELERIEAFCRERDLIGLADEPLEIRWTPLFLRAFGGALLDSPGPLDRGQKAFFAITPIPDDWTPEQAESYLREDNDRMLRLLTIHEAVPGHYLQGVYANRCPSIVRAVFSSGVFAEGWAVYVTQVMMDAGYGADDPALLLTHWKFYLRSITNAVIDVKIHTQAMSEEEAVGLMVDGGFQEEAEARNKYKRARLSSTQLSTYFVGSTQFWELEREVRRRVAAASGAAPDDDPPPSPPVVGGFGESPGFVYRRHLEACISHGAPPMALLRRILLG